MQHGDPSMEKRRKKYLRILTISFENDYLWQYAKAKNLKQAGHKKKNYQSHKQDIRQVWVEQYCFQPLRSENFDVKEAPCIGRHKYNYLDDFWGTKD